MRRAPCVSVEPRDAEAARRILKGAGLLESGLKVGRGGGRILFPVTDLERSLDALRAAGVNAEPCLQEFESAGRGLESPREHGLPGYWIVGDIVIFNPRDGVRVDDLAGYAEELIRRGLARSAWLKVGTHGPYRLPQLLHLAGERRTLTVAREYGLRFAVDVASAYYNPRLSFEHRRVAELVRDGEAVLDMFTGVGGFAVHIAHLRQADVIGVDINPHAVRLALRNVELNKLRGRVCLLRTDAKLLPAILEPVFDRVVMNHPTASLEFVVEACNLVKPGGGRWLHVYTIAGSEEAALQAVEASVVGAGCRVTGIRARRVIDHSPRRFIYSVDVEVERGHGDR